MAPCAARLDPLHRPVPPPSSHLCTPAQALELYISVPKLPLLVSEVVPDPLEDTLALLMSLTVMCTDLWLKGTARVTLRPLLEEMPVVGGVRISLINPPDFGYDLKLGYDLRCEGGVVGQSEWVVGAGCPALVSGSFCLALETRT